MERFGWQLVLPETREVLVQDVGRLDVAHLDAATIRSVEPKEYRNGERTIAIPWRWHQKADDDPTVSKSHRGHSLRPSAIV
jgi:hypothetical protein